jgi:hypothetical protein
MTAVVTEETPAPEPQPVDAAGVLIPTPELPEGWDHVPGTDPTDTVISAESVAAWVAANTPTQATIDAHEVSVGWTAQSSAGIPLEPEGVPGTVVTVAELPSKFSLVATGVDLDQYFANLHPAVAADDAERDAIRGVTK